MAAIAMLGALCALLAVALLLLARHVRWVRREPGLFRCKVRVVSGWVPDHSATWSRRVRRALWASDVLILFHGIGFLHVTALPVACAKGDLQSMSRRAVSRLGSHPVALHLVLEEGPRLEVAAPAKDRALLCGPYVVPQLQPNRGTERLR
jgi:hypothetical protein